MPVVIRVRSSCALDSESSHWHDQHFPRTWSQAVTRMGSISTSSHVTVHFDQFAAGFEILKFYI